MLIKHSIKAVIAIAIIPMTGLLHADQVDEALKGRDIDTIMKLIAEQEKGQAAAPDAVEPVTAGAPAPAQPAEPEAVPTPAAEPVASEPAPEEPAPAAPTATDEISPDELSAIRARLDAELEAARQAEQAARDAAKVAEPAPAPEEEAVEPPKKRGFRLFGSRDKKDETQALPPAQAEPARPVPPRAGPSGDLMSRNRKALDELVAASREDVIRMTMAQASGTEEPAAAAPVVDENAWKKAGPNAWRYNGEWKNGSMHGQGRLSYADGWEYVGTWVNGVMEGQGTLTYADGTRYDGQFANGKMNGLGKLTYPDGWAFIGQWKEGRISGQGSLIHPGN